MLQQGGPNPLAQGEQMAAVCALHPSWRIRPARFSDRKCGLSPSELFGESPSTHYCHTDYPLVL